MKPEDKIIYWRRIAMDRITPSQFTSGHPTSLTLPLPLPLSLYFSLVPPIEDLLTTNYLSKAKRRGVKEMQNERNTTCILINQSRIALRINRLSCNQQLINPLPLPEVVTNKNLIFLPFLASIYNITILDIIRRRGRRERSRFKNYFLLSSIEFSKLN